MAKTAKKAAKASKKTGKTNDKKAAAEAAAKAKATAAKIAALKKKPKDELTGLEKAYLARQSGKGKTTGAKKAKKKRVTFKAPADMKPIFLKADLMIGKDGHLTQSRLTAVKGKLDSDTAKVIELAKYDSLTAMNAIARLAGPMFVKSEKKRLAAGTLLQAVFRVGKNKEGLLGVRLKQLKAKQADSKKAKLVSNKDVMYRTVRKAARPMEAAFTKLKPFPSNKELKALIEPAEDKE